VLIFIAALFCVVVFILLYLLLRVSVAGKNKEYVPIPAWVSSPQMNQDMSVEEELSKPLHQRLLLPLWEKISLVVGRMTPKAIYSMFDEKLNAAGGFRGMSTDTFLLVWVLIAFVMVMGFGFAASMIFRLPAVKVFSAGLLGLAVTLILPLVVLNHLIRSRRNAMQKSLPGILDLIYVSVQAGLSFDGALAKVVEKMRGPLVEECARMLQEIRVGVTRRNALKNLSDRCQIQDISLFTAALIQADQLGVSVAQVLKVQAANVRKKRQLTIRELALQAPVKMLIPLVFFIFPTLFIVLLGPAVITISNSLLNR